MLFVALCIRHTITIVNIKYNRLRFTDCIVELRTAAYFICAIGSIEDQSIFVFIPYSKRMDIS